MRAIGSAHPDQRVSGEESDDGSGFIVGQECGYESPDDEDTRSNSDMEECSLFENSATETK